MAEVNEMVGDSLKLGDRLKHAWNAFRGHDQEKIIQQDVGAGYYTRPDRARLRFGSERSILASIFTRIAIDASSVKIQHAKLDKDERFVDIVDSGLNYCLTVEANIDQTARAFRQDLIMTLLDEGVVAAVPVDTTFNPMDTGSYDIKTMRVARVIEWHPQHVRLELYNERTGLKEPIILPKAQVAIIENPLYAVMNEPISTLKRLIHKLNLLDSADEENLSGKLDLIIQLPYPIKTEMRRQEAEKRRKDVETQLTLSQNKYGVAYLDGTEKITQLNRTVENKLMDQIDYLTSMLYSQLGMTKEVFEGTADERIMLNYISRTIEPIVSAIADEFNRKFLTKTARSQHQQVMYFNDIFRLATVDSLTANGSQLVMSEVITKNELRQRMGYKPVDDQNADQLMNPNINPRVDAGMAPEDGQEETDSDEDWESQYDDSGGGRTIADMKVSEILGT